MSKLLEFRLGNGELVLLNPSFILEVTGNPSETLVTVNKKNANGEYVSYRIPIPVEKFYKMIKSEL